MVYAHVCMCICDACLYTYVTCTCVYVCRNACVYMCDIYLCAGSGCVDIVYMCSACVYVCVHVCWCSCMNMCGICMCVHCMFVGGGCTCPRYLWHLATKRPEEDGFLALSCPFYSLETLNPESSVFLARLTSEPHWSSCFYFPGSTGLPVSCGYVWLFHVNTRHTNSGTYASVITGFPTEPSPCYQWLIS